MKILKYSVAFCLILIFVGLIIVSRYYPSLDQISKEAYQRYGYNIQYLGCDDTPTIIGGEIYTEAHCFISYITDEQAMELGLSDTALGGASRAFEKPGIVLVPSRMLSLDLGTKARILIHESIHLMDYTLNPHLEGLALEERAWGVTIPLFVSDLEKGYYPLTKEDLLNGECLSVVSQTECYLAANYIYEGDEGLNSAIAEIYGE